MDDKKSALNHLPAILTATGGLITAVVGLLAFMSAPAPNIAGFDATPNIIPIGESSILKWSVTGDGVTVDIEPGIGAVALSGSREVMPNNTTSYTLTAKNKDKVKTATLELIVKEKMNTPQANSSATGATITSTPATSTPAPNVVVISVPATNVPATNTPTTSIQASSIPAANIQTTSTPTNSLSSTSAPATKVSSYSIPAAKIPASNAQATNTSANNVPVINIPATTNQVNDITGGPSSSPQPGIAAESNSEVKASEVSNDMPPSDVVSQPSATVKTGDNSEPKSAMKEISSVDWSSIENTSQPKKSLSLSGQDSPLHSKMSSNSNTHLPGHSSDVLSMDSPNSDVPGSGMENPDPLSMDSPSASG